MHKKHGGKVGVKEKHTWKCTNVIYVLILFTFLPMAVLLHLSSSVSIHTDSERSGREPASTVRITSSQKNVILVNEASSQVMNHSTQLSSSSSFLSFNDFSLNFTFSIYPFIPTIKTNIIIGMAQDMDPKYFAVFASSLRLVNKHCLVSILMNEKSITPLILEIASKNKINTVIFVVKQNSKYHKYHPSTLRWLLIPTLLRSITTSDITTNDITTQKIDSDKPTYTPSVLLIDARDSYFQRDPFSYLPTSSQSNPLTFLHTFTGVESITISECGWNGGWIKDCFGTEILQKVGNNHIICSGVTLGDLTTIMAYVDLMSHLISGEKQNLAYFPQCERNGVDQGVHNVIIHTNMIPSIQIYSQSDGLVSNMQSKLYELKSEKLVKGGEIKEVFTLHSNQKVYVAHQYDRNSEFQSYLFNKVFLCFFLYDTSVIYDFI